MKKGILFILLMQLSTFIAISSVAQSWQWARSAACSGGNAAYEYGSEGLLVTTDHANNVYTATYNFGSVLCIDSFTFDNVGYPTNTQIIIAKYDIGGNLLWAIASNNGSALPFCITTDSSDNLIVFGEYDTDSISFGSHLLVNSHFSPSGSNSYYFLAKFDPNGNVIWANTGSTISTSSGILSTISGGIVTDPNGNIYISNGFSDSSIQIGTYTLTNSSPGYDDIFVAKYNPSGNILWAKSYGGNGMDDSYGLTISHDNKLYLTGNFSSSVINFGATSLVYSGSHPTSLGACIFLAEFDTSGNPGWAKSSIGNASSSNTIVDKDNNIYVTGFINDTSIAFGSFEFNNLYLNKGAFLDKYDASGNVIWAKVLCPINLVVGRNGVYGLTIDTSNNVWICGPISANISLDTSTILYSPGTVDPIFFVSYDSHGVLSHYETLPSGGDDNCTIAADNLGNIYLEGDFESYDPFIIGNDSLHLYNGEVENEFTAKYGSNYLVGIQKIDRPTGQICIYPNPTDKEININSTEVIKSVEIENVLGQILYRNSFNSQKIMVSVNNFPNGIYLIKINGTEVRKFVKE